MYPLFSGSGCLPGLCLHLPWFSLLQWCREAWWGGCGAQPVEENGLLCCDPFYKFSSYQRLFCFPQSPVSSHLYSPKAWMQFSLLSEHSLTVITGDHGSSSSLTCLSFAVELAAVHKRKWGFRYVKGTLGLRSCAGAVTDYSKQISVWNFINDVKKPAATVELHEYNFTYPYVMKVSLTRYCDICLIMYYYIYVIQL